MKTLFTLILVFFFIPSFSQIKFKLDSISDNGGIQYKFLYDEYGNNTERILLQWDSDFLDFQPISKNEHTYDSIGNVTVVIHSKYISSNNWSKSSKTEFTYDEYGNITEHNTYSWGNGTWTRYRHVDHENTYENNRLIKTDLHYYTSSGYSKKVYEYTYNEDGKIKEIYYLGDYKYEYFYDLENDTTKVILYHNSSNNWVPETKIILSFNNKFKLEQLQTDFMYSYLFLSYPLQVHIRHIDVTHMITSIKYFNYNDSSKWIFSNELVYHYKQVIETNIPEIRKDEIHVFPNPATDILNIVLPDNIQNPMLNIYSMNGQKLISQQLYNSNSNISIIHLNPGVYLYQIIIADSQEVKGKLVIK